ncbi:MAG: alpha/beta hydrolase [Alphaproteobacteria bacterium]|nr:alpha/beta hydrolase [Alphaproteobacteria bacterium]
MRGLLAGLLLMLSLPAAAQVSGLDGDWDGALPVAGGVRLRLSLHVESHDTMTAATLISLDQGNARIPATITRDGDTVSLDMPAVHAGFKGTLSKDGKSLDGTWTQVTATPLSFTRRAAGATGPATRRRPQEPKPPFPYHSEAVTFAGPGSVTLAGTLTMPDGAGPFPAVVLVQGSGPHDRDETLMGHKPFLVLADALTRRSIAVLRTDKRGVGKSTGDYAGATSNDFAADADASVAYLKSLKSINAKKIGLIGHSEGGLIAPMVAAKDRSVAFIVLLAGPGLKGANIMRMQRRLIGQAMGATPQALDQSEAMAEKLSNIAIAAKDSDTARMQMMDTLSAAGVPTERAIATAGQLSAPWFRFFLSYDPVPTLKQVTCPVLALNGSLDLQVPPKEDLAAIKAALVGNRDVTVEELPGLNHLFQTAKTGAPGEYGEIEETMSPAALAVVGDWIVQRTR